MSWQNFYEVRLIGGGQLVLLLKMPLVLFFAVYFNKKGNYKLFALLSFLLVLLVTVFVFSVIERRNVREMAGNQNEISIVEGVLIFVSESQCVYPEKISRCGALVKVAELEGVKVDFHSNPHLLNSDADYCFEDYNELSGKDVKLYIKYYDTNFSSYRRDVFVEKGKVPCILKIEVLQ